MSVNVVNVATDIICKPFFLILIVKKQSCEAYSFIMMLILITFILMLILMLACLSLPKKRHILPGTCSWMLLTGAEHGSQGWHAALNCFENVTASGLHPC